MVASARAGARALTWELVAHLLTGQVRADLDRLLRVDAGLGMTRLAWLTTPAVDATAAAVKTSIEKLVYLRGMDAHRLDLSMLPAERRRFLATVGRRSTSQALERRDGSPVPDLAGAGGPVRGRPAGRGRGAVRPGGVGAGIAGEVQDRRGTGRAGADRGEARHLLMEVILPVLADPAIPDQQVGVLLREQIGMQRLREAAAGGWKPLPRDHGRLSALQSSYSYLRQFTPDVLSVIDFAGRAGHGGVDGGRDDLEGAEPAGGRKVPEGAPAAFVARPVRRVPGEGPEGRG